MPEARVISRQDDAVDPPVHLQIGGLPATVMSRQDAVAHMVSDCLAARSRRYPSPKLVFASNGQVLSLAARDPSFRAMVWQADYVQADGAPIVAASKLLTRISLPERVPTTDLIHDASRAAADAGLGFYLLGATDDVNAAAAERLGALYPELRIAGRQHGYFDGQDEDRICAEINRSGADVVWVGMGQVREQAFCIRNRERLRAGWLITCGGCFNFLSGAYRRAPDWMQRFGLEWLHRMVTGPRYLIWRYLTTNPHALYLILTRTKRDLISRDMKIVERSREIEV